MRSGKGSLSATAGVGSRSGGCPIRHRKWFASTAIQNAVTAATSLSSISATPAPAQSCGCPTGSSVAAANPAVPPCTGLCSNGKQSGTYVTVNATAVYYPLIPYPMLGSSVTLTAQAFVRIQ